jgi:hypothetical protein
VDRLDDSKGYSFDNIQLVTWRENHMNYIKKLRVPVIIENIKTGEKTTYKLLIDAGEGIGVSHNTISRNIGKVISDTYKVTVDKDLLKDK